jgi:hypothetical protein
MRGFTLKGTNNLVLSVRGPIRGELDEFISEQTLKDGFRPTYTRLQQPLLELLNMIA